MDNDMTNAGLKRAHAGSPDTFDSAKRLKRDPAVPLPASQTVRFLIMSDTHSAHLPPNLPECDVLLHCGDLTEDGAPNSIAEALRALSNVKAELKLAIAGNHDISLDKTYYLAEGGEESDVEQAYGLISPETTSEASKSGVTFLCEGTHKYTLSSGATFTIHASPYTPAYGASAFQYPTDEDRFNPAEHTPAWAKNVVSESSMIPGHVDIVMTHGPAKYILDTTSGGQSAGCEHLRRAIERVRPKLHCFGHIHMGYGAQRLEYAENDTNKADSDTIQPMQKEWVGKNQAAKKGYASLPPGSANEFHQTNQTLCINAAMEGAEATSRMRHGLWN